uniref:Uncharacterized protein n=1 Tax=Auxenochlorella protothecoides TaxID=3075 RepID=A0A1D2A8I7_AUXPR
MAAPFRCGTPCSHRRCQVPAPALPQTMHCRRCKPCAGADASSSPFPPRNAQLPAPEPRPRLALEGPGAEPLTLMSLLEGLAAGIGEVAARLEDAFAQVTQLLRSLGESLRAALDPDGPRPAVHGAPGSAAADPRVGKAVTRLALAVAVFVIFRRAAPGLLMRV